MNNKKLKDASLIELAEAAISRLESDYAWRNRHEMRHGEFLGVDYDDRVNKAKSDAYHFLESLEEIAYSDEHVIVTKSSVETEPSLDGTYRHLLYDAAAKAQAYIADGNAKLIELGIGPKGYFGSIDSKEMEFERLLEEIGLPVCLSLPENAEGRGQRTLVITNS